MYWLDYSAAKLSGATIKAAGYGGVIRYIDAPDRLRMKHTNLAEYRDHVANGLIVRLVMQNATTDADGGHSAGVANAQRAKAGAAYLGYTGVIFFTNDRTTVPNPAAWTAYLDGAAAVLGKNRVGAYGFANALSFARGHAAAFWQAGRKSELVGHANFWQDNNTQVTVGGVLCDRNLVIADYHPEDDMPLTPDDITKFVNAMRDRVLATDHDPKDPNAKTDTVWTIGGRSLYDHLADARARTEAIQSTLAEVALKVAAQQSVPVAELAQALLPGLLAGVKEDLADVAHLDEDAVADRLAANLTARLAQ